MDTLNTPAVSDVDIDLEAEVTEAIMAMDGLRPTAADVRVSVVDGHVTLTGHVQSPMQKAEIERAAAEVAGAAAVTNRLFDDASLSRQAAELLARDERTRNLAPGYRVNATFGNVTLAGRVSEAEAREVLSVLQNLPGVRAVSVRAI